MMAAPCAPPIRSHGAYEAAFATEAAETYAVVDAFEARMGYAVDRIRLLDAARVLACPLKVHPPNWQHGRVLYAAARHRLEGVRGRVLALDIGTAKGFSALCLQWALQDAGVRGTVVSVDVIDPRSRQSRNTIAELDAPKTLAELLQPWPEASEIKCVQSTGIDWLTRYTGRIEIAFVDGKHAAEVVSTEGRLLSDRQQAGDVVLFDDVHLPPVRAAVEGLIGGGDPDWAYRMEWLTVLPLRAYAIGRRQ